MIPASSSDHAYAHVREQILTGVLADDSLISEGEIAAALGISRTPVREAFLRLQAEGWLRLYPKRGALVRGLSEQDVREIVEARLVIESAAGRGAAARLEERSALAAELRAIIAEQREASGDLDRFVHADVRFHRTVVAAGGNAVLEDFYQLLQDRQRRLVARSLRRRPGAEDLVLRQHAELAELLASGDADGFAQALTAHLHDVHGGAAR